MSESESVRELLEAVARGEISPRVAAQKVDWASATLSPPEKIGHRALSGVEGQPYEPVGDFAKIDYDRAARTGFPEVIWGQDKTAAQIADIMKVMISGQSASQPVVMATRVSLEKSEAIRKVLPQVTYFEMARICAVVPFDSAQGSVFDYAQGAGKGRDVLPGRLSILTAGTADLPVAEEAAVTAELCGFAVTRLWDVGVAGIQRLLSNQHVIDQSDVLIVAAGMEGALPSVVAGLASCPVIAVPTSIGYGASFQGLAPLLTMLNSCATGIGVVNIDNGFGAAILAGQILRVAGRIKDR